MILSFVKDVIVDLGVLSLRELGEEWLAGNDSSECPSLPIFKDAEPACGDTVDVPVLEDGFNSRI
jgi:hypothetical protein